MSRMIGDMHRAELKASSEKPGDAKYLDQMLSYVQARWEEDPYPDAQFDQKCPCGKTYKTYRNCCGKKADRNWREKWLYT